MAAGNSSLITSGDIDFVVVDLLSRICSISLQACSALGLAPRRHDSFVKAQSLREYRPHRVKVGEMEIPNSFDHRQIEKINELRAVDRRHLKCIFRQCNPPAIESFIGEFDAELLDQGGSAAASVVRLIFGSSGEWLGKAFRPINAERGVGYNCFRSGDLVTAKLPMDTAIEDSQLDEGKSLTISYQLRNFGLIRWLKGEVREVVPGVMLGMGLFGPKLGKRDRLRRKIPFLMLGPVRAYQFDHPAAPAELKRAA